MKRNWLKFSLLYFITIALLGTLLRYTFVGTLPWINYKYFLHAHSHVALLGWLYSAFFIALITAFLKEKEQVKRTYQIQFWGTQATVLGMLFSFPFQGYAAVSITFSSLHILFSYWFIFQFMADAKKNEENKQKYFLSYQLVKWSLIFLALSSIGPWSLAPIMAQGLNGTHLYFLTIYFYLHFQYNGWFTLALFGLLFWWLENKNIEYPKKEARIFIHLIAFSCIPAYALSTLWTKPDQWVYWVGGFAALAQVAALFFIARIIWNIWPQIKTNLNFISPGLLLLSAICFASKIFMQFLSAFPAMADLAYLVRNFVIGYLHLTLIGFVSLFLFVFYFELGWLSFRNIWSKAGLLMFLIGFLLSEALIFLQAIWYWWRLGNIPSYFFSLFLVSLLMFLGLLTFWVGQMSKRNNDSLQY